MFDVLRSNRLEIPVQVDFRLVRVPRGAVSDAGPRTVFRYEEEQIPRFTGSARGPIPPYMDDRN